MRIPVRPPGDYNLLDQSATWGLQSHYMDWLNTVEPHKVGQDNTALPHTPPGLKGMLLH